MSDDDILDFLDELDLGTPVATNTPVATPSSDDGLIDPLDELKSTQKTNSSLSHINPLTVSGKVGQKVDVTNYLDKIIKNSAISNEIASLVLSRMSKLSTLENLNELQDDNKKGLREVNKFYWDIYAGICARMFENENASMGEMRLFLEFGLLDELFAKPDALDFLQNYTTNNQISNNPKQLNILTLVEWLRLIYKDVEVPSVTDMGIDYGKFLRDRVKFASQKEKQALESLTPKQNAEFRVNYELKNMVNSVARLLLLNPSNSPLFFDSSTNGSPTTTIVTPKHITTLVEEIKGYDYSLFYRESLFKISATANEIIDVEVLPYFIIFPVTGDKIFFWQEFSQNKKTNRARIMIPMFFVGDMRAEMIKALGSFRWELCRSIKGSLWADPVEGGITGAFYDYVTFYKKNSKLSFEAKEKLEDLIKRCRKDPKRLFLLYYHFWIESERNGVMRLDRAARDLFFKYIPFSKDVSDKIMRIPLYAEIITKFKNLNQRKIAALEMRYAKKKDSNGNLPPELQENIDFLKK